MTRLVAFAAAGDTATPPQLPDHCAPFGCHAVPGA